MKRREFITLLGGAAVAWPLAGFAQTLPKMLRVGLVSSANPRTAPQFVAFDQRLRELGYVEGQSLAVEFIALEGTLNAWAKQCRTWSGARST
ncbi:MAG: hypothetical protein ACHP9S_11620 [Terriglobales bacterium]